MLVICSFREGEVQFKAFAKCRNTDFLRNLQTARKGRRSFVVVSKFSFSHPPTIPWVLTHTVGPITLYHRAWPEITTHTRGPQHARPRQAMPRLALHTGPHPARQWPGPPLAPARTRPGPLASTTHSHASTSTHRIRRRNTASPQVASHALHSGPQIAPARHGPAPLTRITHGPNWGNPFVTHFIDLSHGVKRYSYKWVARLTRLQEPPSPSRSEVTARLRPGSRMQTPGGTHAEL